MSLRKYDKEWLEELCKDSYSLSEVVRRAGRKGGGSQATIKKKIEEFDIDISHFTGQTWNKGKTMQTDERIRNAVLNHEKYSYEEIFIENSPVTQKVLIGYIKRHNLLEYKCDNCGCNGEWQGGTISLELDHINGINNDNRMENLRYLCPNCHALTDTYKGRNKEKGVKRKNEISEEEFVEALQNYPNIRQALIALNLAPQGGNYTRAKQLIEKYNIQKS